MASKPQRRHRYNDDVLVVGIDIAKRGHVAVADGPDGQVSKPFAFANDHAGFVAFTAWLGDQLRRWQLHQVVLGMEPTGHYWKPLAEWLDGRGYALRMVSPLHTSRAKEIEDGSPLKTDAKDARVIADLIRQGKGRPCRLLDGPYQDLRYLVELRKRLSRERIALLHRLARVMDLLFPELLPLFSKIDGMGLHALLRVAATPDAVLALGHAGVAAVLRAGSNGKLRPARAAEVMAAAVTSVGCRHGRAALECALQALWPRLDAVNAQLGLVERRLETTLQQIDYASLLLSIPGIGPVTAAVVLGELGDLRSYRTARQVLKMAGLNLFEKSSGEHQGDDRITKRGRSYLRQILFLAAIRMFKRGRALYALRRKHGATKPGAKLVVAGMRRLLRAMFAMARDGLGFDPTRFIYRAEEVVAA